MKLKVIDNGTGQVVFEKQELSSVSFSIDGGDFVARATTATAKPTAGSGAVFPPYGRSKGMPIAGATVEDLNFYKAGSERTLNDVSKERWHDKERAFLALIDAELSKHGQPNPTDGTPF